MSKIIDRTGKGAAISQAENDANLDSLHGINQAVAGATFTVDITDQGDTLEFTNGGAVAVTLDDIATIQAAAHTSDFMVKLIAVGAGTVVTITPDATDTINTGATTIVLAENEYVVLQTDSTGAIWNVISSSSIAPTALKDANNNELLEFGTTGSAVNHAKVTNAATGVYPDISTAGEVDIGFNFKNSSGEKIAVLAPNANPTVWPLLKATAGAAAQIHASSDAAVADMGLSLWDTNSNELLELDSVASAVNNVVITNATTGAAASISTSETNTDLSLAGNGTGGVYGTIKTHNDGVVTLNTKEQVTFTGIPSWVKRITIAAWDMTVDASVIANIILGDSGGLETTATYDHGRTTIEGATPSAAGTENAVAAQLFTMNVGTDKCHTEIVLTLCDSSTNTWLIRSNTIEIDSTGLDAGFSSIGYKALSATLDRVQFRIDAGDSWTAGSVVCHYEG